MYSGKRQTQDSNVLREEIDTDNNVHREETVTGQQRTQGRDRHRTTTYIGKR